MERGTEMAKAHKAVMARILEAQSELRTLLVFDKDGEPVLNQDRMLQEIAESIWCAYEAISLAGNIHFESMAAAS